MIFLHGANSAGAELQAFVDAMKPYTPVRTPDLLGHRGRPIHDRITIGDVADDIVAWMDREGIDRDVLGGYSFGGTVALYLARHHPARVSGVVPLASKHVFDATTLQRWTHLLSHARVEGITLPGGIRRVDELTRLHAPSKWQDVLDLRYAGQSHELTVPVQLRLNLTVDGTNFDDVGDFHRKFQLPSVPAGGGGAEPGHVVEFDESLYQFRLKFLKEELKEFERGWKAGDLPQVADALVDLVYVALGTAQLLGLPWQELWDEVQRANMSKVRASTAVESMRSTGRGHASDVLKPPDFVPPDIAGILERRGFDLTWEVE